MNSRNEGEIGQQAERQEDSKGREEREQGSRQQSRRSGRWRERGRRRQGKAVSVRAIT